MKKRLQSFKHAWNGIKILFAEEPNARVHLVAVVLVVILSIVLDINANEWMAILFSIGLVLSAEIFNTAVEHISDYISPGRNEQIKRIKDLSAAAVLICALTASAIGLIIFLPKIKF